MAEEFFIVKLPAIKCKHCGAKATVHGELKENVSDFYCLSCMKHEYKDPEYLIDCPHCDLQIPVN